MKIVVHTPRGAVIAAANTAENTFRMIGDDAAVQYLQRVAPVLQPDGNLVEHAPDILNRLLLIPTDGEAVPGRLMPHDELVNDTLTENPLVLFQVRDPGVEDALGYLLGIIEESQDEAAVNSAKLAKDALEDSWKTERVFMDPREAKRFVEAQRHRYAPEYDGSKWRFYTGIADGTLKRVAKEARDLANL